MAKPTLGKTLFLAQLFGETDEHWLLKVGKRPEVEFELDEDDPTLNQFFTISFTKDPPEDRRDSDAE